MAGNVEITWLGHATFKFRTPGGKTVLVDPWVTNNPACPDDQKKFAGIDAMLITHGHFDHIADAVALGKEHKPTVACVFETGLWLEGKGVENISGMNKGGTQVIGDIKVTMVHADHSCGILDDGKVIYGGEACGYVIEFDNGLRVYHAGDTNVFGDMKIIHELYEPHVAMLPIGDLFTMGPREAAYAAKLLSVGKIIPMHFGTFPPLVGRPSQLRELIGGMKTEVIDPVAGKAMSLAP